jgi:mRNA interferase RelE/StbE
LARYRITVKSSVVKALQELPADIRSRVSRRIDSLAEDPRPRGTEKLAGAEDLYRVCVGVYRLIYQVRDKELVVLLLRLGHRREIYR